MASVPIWANCAQRSTAPTSDWRWRSPWPHRCANASSSSNSARWHLPQAAPPSGGRPFAAASRHSRPGATCADDHRLDVELRRAIDQSLAASPKKLGRSQSNKIRRKWRAQVDEHLRQTLKVTQLAAWERLFGLWHVLHLPFVYVMVLCAVAHVVAVHAY